MSITEVTTARNLESIKIFKHGLSRGYNINIPKNIDRIELLIKQMAMDVLDWDDTNEYLSQADRIKLIGFITKPTLDSLTL